MPKGAQREEQAAKLVGAECHRGQSGFSGVPESLLDPEKSQASSPGPGPLIRPLRQLRQMLI